MLALGRYRRSLTTSAAEASAVARADAAATTTIEIECARKHRFGATHDVLKRQGWCPICQAEKDRAEQAKAAEAALNACLLTDSWNANSQPRHVSGFQLLSSATFLDPLPFLLKPLAHLSLNRGIVLDMAAIESSMKESKPLRQNQTLNPQWLRVDASTRSGLEPRGLSD